MFTVPILYDSTKFSPKEKSRQIVKKILEFILWGQVIIGILGVIGIVNCVNTQELVIVINKANLLKTNFQFKLLYLWIFIGIDVVLTFADTVLARPPIQNENADITFNY